ncbi:MAG: methionine ABC transporter permease, partial [Longicatena sp.]
ENQVVYFILGKIVDLFRAIPFIILVGFISPITRMIMGTGIGVEGALVPLVVGTIPFFARQVESALAQIDRGLIEASQAMGSSPIEIIFRVYLRESIPGIIRATTITLISLLGFITMVGAIGGGGIGDFAIRYGFNSYQYDVTIVCVIVLLLITSLIQFIGNIFVRKATH